MSVTSNRPISLAFESNPWMSVPRHPAGRPLMLLLVTDWLQLSFPVQQRTTSPRAHQTGCAVYIFDARGRIKCNFYYL